MGYWELTVEKTLKDGSVTTEVRKLSNDDIGHIMELIRERYSGGDLNDEVEG